VLNERTWPVPSTNARARALFHAVPSTIRGCGGSGLALQVSFPLNKGRTVREQPVLLGDGSLRFFRVAVECVPRYVKLGLVAEFARARNSGARYRNDMKE
jgi:hypothetical protein